MSPSPAAAASPVAFDALDEHYERVPITHIVPSKTNPRTHFDEEYLARLAQSIREKGVLEPILLRPRPTKGIAAPVYEIVAGECRYRAAERTTVTHLPAVIREYSDEQVLEIQLEENIHRKDLTPLEEATGYRRLITMNPDKHSAATIAARIGMSVSYVWDYLKLLDLIPAAKEILERKLMTVAHAILIARLKPEDQERVVTPGPRNGWSLNGLWQGDAARLTLGDAGGVRETDKKDPYADLKAVSVRELDTWIKEHIRFDVAYAAKAVPLAFEPVAAAVAAADEQPGRGKKVIPITFGYRVADDARDDSERTYGAESWQRADGQQKSKRCEHSVLGVVVAGSQHYGQTLQVCIARDTCRVHFGEVIKAKEKAAKLRASGKPTQAAKVEKKQEQSWDRDNRLREEARKRWAVVQPYAIAAAVAKLKPAAVTDKVLQHVIEMLMNDQSYDELEKHLGGRVTAKNFTRALAIIDIMDHDHTRDGFAKIAKKYGVDLAKLEKELAAKAAAAPAKKAAAGA